MGKWLLLLSFLVAITTSQNSFAGDPERGKYISNHCAMCHGENGNTNHHHHPKLAGQNEGYLIWQLMAFKDGTRPSHVMNDIAEGLTQGDIEDLSAYYASLGVSCD